MSAGEKLSQEQIDALLRAVQEGDDLPGFVEEQEAQEKYQEYDFNRPEKFGVEHLRSLQTVATSFGKATMQSVSARIRLPIEMEPVETEQVPFLSEYVEKMPKDYYLFCVMDLGHEELGDIVIEMDLAFILYLHECFLGGDPKADLKGRRALTSFELITLENLFSIICENLRQAFESIVSIQPRLKAMYTVPDGLKITTASDIMALLHINMKTEFWDTTLRVGIPFLSVETIMDQLTSENVIDRIFGNVETYTEQVEQELKKMPRPVHISIGTQTTTIGELKQVEVGDIIPLGTKVTAPLQGYVSGKAKFHCFIGREGNRKAFLFHEHLKNDEK
ncbi:flagellar motor switch protein FliM [Ectobacillus sp. JY-23]|uniref:flagellar motor switch protein FliM n=1 Tax=Ectobacillus sp. JY-23 TaxID=2933872 RepID=UPI001FF46478|nr:flagellar motor switch protein FliM [Ectobacillus sp. JY-23]UOY93370.1 flagellar motor switch protein FliM [Ectobacillus sp. JY-23]